jgi:TRAP transporter TAXI family solute receptor
MMYFPLMWMGSKGRCRFLSLFLSIIFLFELGPALGQEPEYPARSPVADIVFLTGRESGTYFALGRSIKELVEKNTKSMQIMCQPSMGSLENATLLEANRANLAIIQSDIAYSLYSGTRFFPLPSSRIKVICPLHSEVVHIITRQSNYITSIEGLENHIVSVGEQGSGAEVNASMILAAVNLTYRNITPVFKNLEDSIDLLRAGKIDAFFATTRSPSKTVAALLEDPKYTLLKMKPPEVERIIRGYPYIYPYTIERGTYVNQTQQIMTINVRALLIVHSEVSDSKVYQLTKILFENKAYLKSKFPFLELDEKGAVSDLRLPLHPGAREYFIEVGVLKGQSVFVFIGAILFVIAGASLLIRFFIKPPKKLRRFARNFYARYATLFLSFVLIASYGMHLSERAINANFISFGQSIWSCLVYLVSGFGDRAPVTSLGKFLSILIFLMGVSVVGIVSGGFASYFIDKTIRKEKKMPANMSNHIVICNWNAKANKIIEELFQSEADMKEDVHVVLLTGKSDRRITRLEGKYSGFSMTTGDPVLHEHLAGVNIHKARSVIILAKEDCPDPDAQTALIALAINQVCRDKAVDEHIKEHKLDKGPGVRQELENSLKIKPPHIVADVVNHMKTKHLSDANVKEIVCSTDYGIGLLAQSAIHPGLVKVYDQLLKFTAEGNELYLLDSRALPPDLVNRDFKGLAVWFEENFRESKNPMILLGFLRSGEPILNPHKDQAKLRGDDQLIILAYCSPRLTDFAKCDKLRTA